MESSLRLADRLLAHLMSALVAITVFLIGLFWLTDYARAADFLLYRLAHNLHNGHGIVYNASEKILLVFSPLPLLPLAIVPDFAHYTALVVNAIAFGLAAGSLFQLCRRAGISRPEVILLLAVWLSAYPVWAGLRSPSAIAFAFILFALEAALLNRLARAGLWAGLAILADPSGVIGAMLVGVYLFGNSRLLRYWVALALPVGIWAGYVIFYYPDGILNGLTMGLVAPEGNADLALLWVGILAMAFFALVRSQNIPKWVWIFPLWASLEIGAQMIIFSELASVESITLAFTMAMALILSIQRMQRLEVRYAIITTGLVLLLLFLIAFPPKTEPYLADDIARSKNLALPAQRNFVHDRSDALTYYMRDFEGEVYRLDGKRSLIVADFVERKDWQSLIVALTPDYVYFDQTDPKFMGLDMAAEALQPLDYVQQLNLRLQAGEKEGDILWIRRHPVSPFGSTQAVTIDYGLDMRLVGYAVSTDRPLPGDTVRLRLDWQLKQLPTQEVGVFVNLIPTDGLPVASVFPGFPASNWESAISTYHALALPTNVLPGILRLNVTVNYEAGILGEHTVGIVAIPPAVVLDESFLATEPLGNLGEVSLLGARLTPAERQLRVDVVWQPNTLMEKDYRIFVHFIPAGDVIPVAQADSPPLGGRYPTSVWQHGETIPDTFFIPLENVPAGDYYVRVGIYSPEDNTRLVGEQGDGLLLGEVQIDTDGRIIIHQQDFLFG